MVGLKNSFLNLYNFSFRKNFDGMLKQYNYRMKISRIVQYLYDIGKNNIGV